MQTDERTQNAQTVGSGALLGVNASQTNLVFSVQSVMVASNPPTICMMVSTNGTTWREIKLNDCN